MKMISKRKIKPCLKCGLKDFIITFEEKKKWNICCTSCHLLLTDYENEESAVKAWNDFSRKIDNLIYEKYTLGYEHGKLSEIENEEL